MKWPKSFWYDTWPEVVEKPENCGGKYDKCIWQDQHIHGVMCSRSCLGCNKVS